MGIIGVAGAQTDDPQASDEEELQLESFTVTGSRLKRTDYETAFPVLSIGREQIDRSGATNIGDLLQDIPAAGAALNTTFNNGGTGATEVDLRNLGSQRVLVLVNGRRWVNGVRSSASSAVDLATIPVSIIERIEILKDGASAVYGSDAISGVVNIITRKEYQGAQANSYVGLFDEGDGETQQYNASFGNVSDKTSLFVDLNFTKQEPVFAGDRAISDTPVVGTGNAFGSSGTPRGRFLFFADPDGNAAATGNCNDVGDTAPLCDLTLIAGEDGQEAADFRPFGAQDRYNFAPINYLTTPSERSSLFTQIGYQFTDSIRLDTTVLYNVRKSSQLLAETPLFLGDLAGTPSDRIVVAEDQAFNPFDQVIGRDQFPDDPNNSQGSGFIGRRQVEIGQREFIQDVDTFLLTSALNGSALVLDRFVDWEAGYTVADSRNAERTSGLLNLDHVRLALGPAAACAGDQDCVPLNVFGGPGTITGPQQDYIAYTGINQQQQRFQHLFAYASTDLFVLPAGPVAGGFGLEFRDESYENQPDPLIVQGISSTNRAQPTSGEYLVREASAELELPILEGFPFAESLDLNLAARYADYTAFASETTTKAGLRWLPVQDLLVRASFSEAFRAPSISDLFQGLSDSFPAVEDPCSDYTAEGVDQATQDNCAADGVPESYSQINPQLLSRVGGNPELTPETANIFTTGIVYSPRFVPELNFTLDYYRIAIDNTITTLGAQFILEACYASESRAFCDFVDRQDSGIINTISNLNVNIGSTETSGFDFTVDYQWDMAGYGTFDFVIDSAYLIDYFDFTPGGKIRRHGLNFGDTAFPRWKSNATLGWSMGQMSASWTARFIYHVTEDCPVAAAGFAELCSDPEPADPDGNGTAVAQNKIGSTTYHDVQFEYTLPGLELDLALGARNIFDKEPPISYTAFANSFNAASYDIPGIFTYFKIGKRF